MSLRLRSTQFQESSCGHDCKHLSGNRVLLGLDIEDAQGNRKPLPMDAVKWFKQLGFWRGHGTLQGPRSLEALKPGF